MKYKAISSSLFLLMLLLSSSTLLSRTLGDLPVDNQLPVVLELFTSQGCSSCPPADRLLAELAEEPAIGSVIPLAFHVDYWNYLGWKDPYSNEKWSDRQADYAGAFGASSLYTPQMVIQGQEQAIGSSRADVIRAIKEVSTRTRVDVLANLSIDSKGSAKVEVSTKNEAGLDLTQAEYLLLLVQKKKATDVLSGENAGHVLENQHVVVNLVKERARQHRTTLRMTLGAGEGLSNYRLVVLLQDRITRTIYGSRALDF